MLLDSFLHTAVDPNDRLIQNAMKDYFTLKTGQDLGESAFSSMFGGNSLSDQNQRLDIELKKRQLNAMGPQDSEAFNDLPAAKILGALGITWGRELQPAARAGIGAAKDSGLLRQALTGVSHAKELGNVPRSIVGTHLWGLLSEPERLFHLRNISKL